MKLYTEEQVYDAISKAFRYKSNLEILNSLTPIVLLTDEEIENSAKVYAYIIGNKNGTAIFDYIKGAKWMRDKIKGGNQ